MNCKMCAIFMYQKDKQSLKLETLAGPDEGIDYNEELKLGHRTLGVVIARKSKVEVRDLPHTEEHHFLPIKQKQNLL